MDRKMTPESKEEIELEKDLEPEDEVGPEDEFECKKEIELEDEKDSHWNGKVQNKQILIVKGKSYVFLRYAARYWAKHFEQAQIKRLLH